MTSPFDKSLKSAEELIFKSKDVVKGKSLADSGIDPSWMASYAAIARRCRDDRKVGLSRYPYEPGPSVSAFCGGFFENRQWPIRLALEKQSSMKTVAMHEANNINATGYWLSFYEASIQLRQEAITENKQTEAERYDVWAILAVRYALRVLGLRTEFYKLASEDPVTAKLILPGLERRLDIPAADNIVDSMETLDSHMMTQLMKAVATMKTSNAKNKAGGQKGGAADGQ